MVITASLCDGFVEYYSLVANGGSSHKLSLMLRLVGHWQWVLMLMLIYVIRGGTWKIDLSLMYLSKLSSFECIKISQSLIILSVSLLLPCTHWKI